MDNHHHNSNNDEDAVTDLELAEAASVLAAAASTDPLTGLETGEDQTEEKNRVVGGGSCGGSSSSSSAPARIETTTENQLTHLDDAVAATTTAGRKNVEMAVSVAAAAATTASDKENDGDDKRHKREAASSTTHAPPSKRSRRSHEPAFYLSSTFNDFVYQLVLFQMENGHCRVPVKKGGNLGKWMAKIRQEYKKVKPTLIPAAAAAAETARKENMVNRGFHDNQKQSSGQSRNTTVSSMAASTIHDSLYLNQERIAVLTHLGMVWEFPNEDYEETWQEQYHKLIKFKEANGHTNVPQKGYGKLSWWVKIQREVYQNTVASSSSAAAAAATTTTTSHQEVEASSSSSSSRNRPRQTMPQHRIKLLESIGFEWRIRPPTKSWDERFTELVKYKNTFGNCNVPQAYPSNKVLGKWVMKQRGFYYDKVRGKKSPLSKERQDKLEAIGFCWVAPHVAKTKAKLPLRKKGDHGLVDQEPEDQMIPEEAFEEGGERQDDATPDQDQYIIIQPLPHHHHEDQQQQEEEHEHTIQALMDHQYHQQQEQNPTLDQATMHHLPPPSPVHEHTHVQLSQPQYDFFSNSQQQQQHHESPGMEGSQGAMHGQLEHVGQQPDTAAAAHFFNYQ